jgi:hypothetical protein
MTRHLIFTPRCRNAELLAQLNETHTRLHQLVHRARTGLVTGTHMEIEIAAIVANLVAAESFLQNPDMDWRHLND